MCCLNLVLFISGILLLVCHNHSFAVYHVCTYIRTYVYNLSLCVHMYIGKYVHMYVPPYSCICTYTYVCSLIVYLVPTYMYVHTGYRHPYLYMCTYIYVLTWYVHVSLPVHT